MRRSILATSILSAFVLITSCSDKKESKNETTTAQKVQQEAPLVSAFLKDVQSLKSADTKRPIQDFIAQAEKTAALKVEFNKDNIKQVLTQAESFNNLVILVGEHTLVKVIDLKDCQQSGSWGVCMPKAEGFIKRGELNYKQDYLNNIIGRADAQMRKAYLF